MYKVFGREPSDEVIAWALMGLGRAIAKCGSDRVRAAFAPDIDNGYEYSDVYVEWVDGPGLTDYNYEFVAHLVSRTLDS